MIQDVLRSMDMDVLWNTGLVMLFVVFLGILLWVLTRPAKRVEQWSKMPLTNDDVKETP